MKYLEDPRFTKLTSDLTAAVLNTRGSGNGGGSSMVGLVRSRNANSKGKKQQKQSGGGSSGTSNKRSTSSAAATSEYYAYNPVGYTTYNNGGGPSSSSSCRVIYGRVEAYTTKRAGSDKKTAFEVGEKYAHEMERLNEAVEALKRRHASESQQETGGGSNDASAKVAGGKGSGSGGSGGGKDRKVERRGRSRSLDGVTFATSASPQLVYDKSANAAAMMLEGAAPEPGLPLEEGPALVQEGSEPFASHAKRDLPLEGILKQPSSNKRCRATSFDISTGPSTASVAGRRYHHSESSSSLLAGSSWGSAANTGSLPLSVVHPSIAIDEDESALHPLIPQPSLYQSSLSEHHTNGEKALGPTMVPRRLVTDLILTLNASFPDYDFGDAQVSDFCTLSTPEAMRRINEKLGEFAATTDEGRDFLPRFWSSLDDVLFNGLKDCDVYSYAPKGSTGEDDPLEFLTMTLADDNSGSPNNGGDGIVGAQDVQRVMFSPSGGGRIVSGDGLNDGLDTSMALDLPNQISPASGNESPPHVTLWSMNYFFVSRNRKRIVLFACVQTMRSPVGNDDDEDSEDYDAYNENDLVFDEARRDDIIQMQQEAKEDGCVKAELASTSGGDESVSVFVEDTDFDDVGVDVDGEIDQGENDFDTGTLGVGVASQVA